MDMKDLANKILSEPLISRVFSAGIEAFLVGGYLRDIMRDVRSGDIDFVIRGDIRKIVSRIFPEDEKTTIEFKKDLLVRIVVGDIFIDFTGLQGRLEDDLKRRDFGMNAIAWSPGSGLVDPLNGIKDIKECVIRGMAKDNFIDDPLRLLRAYRFSSELGWKIHETTRSLIRNIKKQIKLSAPERITLEVFKLLNANGYLSALKTGLNDGLIQEILAINNSRLMNNIKALSRLNSFLNKLPEDYNFPFNKGACLSGRQGLRVSFSEDFSQGLSRLGLLRLERLLYGTDLTRNRLRMSRAIYKRVKIISRLLEEYEENRNIDHSKIFEFLFEAKEASMDFALLTCRKRLMRKAELLMKMRPVLPAGKILESAGVISGPGCGSLLKELKKQQFLGRIKSERDALKWLSKQF